MIPGIEGINEMLVPSVANVAPSQAKSNNSSSPVSGAKIYTAHIPAATSAGAAIEPNDKLIVPSIP